MSDLTNHLKAFRRILSKPFSRPVVTAMSTVPVSAIEINETRHTKGAGDAMKGEIARRLWSRMERLCRAALAPMVVTLASVAASPAALKADEWVQGDVFVGVGSGLYRVFDNSGVFKETIFNGWVGQTAGCAFNPGKTRLYTTDFENAQVVAFNNSHPHSIAQSISTALQGGEASESIVFAANGDFYVGHANSVAIQKFNAAGVFQQAFDVEGERRGSDWVDLASDQCTIFYTSEGSSIKRFDVCTNTQLDDFATDLPDRFAFALRLLSNGGALVADTEAIHRLDASGAVVKSYDTPGDDFWFALNLDPNGTSFWSGDAVTGNFYRFNIASGAVEVGPINAEPESSLSGICVKGESTIAIEGPPGSPTCSDAIDNDGDGLIDGRDPDCGDVSPRALLVDAAAGAASDGNGVFEPGETASSHPHGETTATGPSSSTGAGSAPDGPIGPTYATADAAASYGSIAPDATKSCSVTGNCYSISISDPPTRPAPHWDATFTETVDPGSPKVWTLHLGESFPDVSRSHPFYKKIEAIFHKVITVGCTPTQYCPAQKVPRSQMAIFIARGVADGIALPTTGLVDGAPYDCTSGGTSRSYATSRRRTSSAKPFTTSPRRT